ncbi:ecdysone 20-monooxygenase [Pseudomyrmex gracilis]|uniref:ecdysone 20-monooxygenase n=1 Tax=Pseudomyrmex gracilis TaxID=219809 RepID=UPI000995374A|nr:ecdysone 20-monooxygenase [Pseudomyrmex gracilis]
MLLDKMTFTTMATTMITHFKHGFDWRMLLSGAWFETIAAALLAILVLATGYRPPWWFWTRNHNTNADAGDNGNRKFKSGRDVPGPLALPIFGTRWIFSRFGHYSMNKIHEAYKDLNRQYGPLCKEEALWNCLVVSVFSRRDIEAVLKRGSRYPLRPPQEVISHYRRSRRDRYTNLGLVNEQGATWQKLRSALTPELTGASTVFGFFPALNIVTDGFIELIRKRRSGSTTVAGFEELAYKMGLESTCTLILGRHLGFLKPDSSSTLTIRLAEAVRIHFTASRDAFYGLPLWKLLPTSAYKQLIESEDAIYKYVFVYVIYFRLMPTTPCIARILDEPIELGGYRLDPGTVVLLHTWIAGMSKENFKDASECMPERWLKPTLPHSPLLVAPFGAGRRICPGKRFVELALQLILAKIAREFEIVVEEELSLQFEFILAPQSPVSLGFRDRMSKVEVA